MRRRDIISGRNCDLASQGIVTSPDSHGHAGSRKASAKSAMVRASGNLPVEMRVLAVRPKMSGFVPPSHGAASRGMDGTDAEAPNHRDGEGALPSDSPNGSSPRSVLIHGPLLWALSIPTTRISAPHGASLSETRGDRQLGRPVVGSSWKPTNAILVPRWSRDNQDPVCETPDGQRAQAAVCLSQVQGDMSYQFRFWESLVNFVTGLGIPSLDKSAGAYWLYVPIPREHLNKFIPGFRRGG